MSYRRLTQAEIEALRAEMREAGAWAKTELKRRREAKNRPHKGSNLGS